jgi:pyruvate,water dikinase
VEWSLTPDGRLVVLQSRPLAVARDGEQTPPPPPLAGETVLLTGGDPACPGAGSGPVHLVRRDEDLEDFPEGGVLVASQSSPKFIVIMPRARAILADFGSVTGHMASLAREFGVPALLGLGTATRDLAPGRVVTVDATGRRVYDGRVEALLAARPGQPPASMTGTPVEAILKQVAALVAPLNLLDPKSPEFAPDSCRTVHDIMRYLHEKSYGEMFRISDLASGQEGVALRLDAPTGLDLHVIDLGGGLDCSQRTGRGIPVEGVASEPFKALLQGLVLAHCQIAAPRPVHLKGFLSVLGEQMVSSNQVGRERFGEKSYAIVSDKYLNFSSRVGYHYGVLDCYCGRTVTKNYITFSFKGGAAGEEKRTRRARSIALMLEGMGYLVDVQGDRVVGRFTKCEAPVIAAKLVDMGRLLQFTRQTDMLMTSEACVQAMADSFLAGHDHFDPARDMPRPAG